MLIKITNYCSMGCNHCMEDSTIKGEHMTEETFLSALEFTTKSESLAYISGFPPLIGISGGECSENPELIKFMEIAIARTFQIILITNGMWLENKDLRESILRPEWKDLQIQITNDSRFYPKKPPTVDDKRITYVDSLQHLIPLGRAGRKNLTSLHYAKSPTSFNLRSMTRSFGSYTKAVAHLRMRFLSGKGGFCTPTILEDGRITAGETRNCYIVGNTKSSMDDITKALCDMKCNKCGLEDNLSSLHKAAIGA